jgi:hypothetical protein
MGHNEGCGESRARRTRIEPLEPEGDELTEEGMRLVVGGAGVTFYYATYTGYTGGAFDFKRDKGYTIDPF